MPPFNLKQFLRELLFAWPLSFFVHRPQTGDVYYAHNWDGKLFREVLKSPTWDDPWGEWTTESGGIVRCWPYGDWKRVP